MKPNICLDFDGVFNEYKGYDGDNIGRPRPGIKEFLEQLSQEYTIIVCSVRKFPMIIKWLEEHKLRQYVTSVTSFKPPAIAYLDDRGIRFDGDYDKALKDIKSFRTYWEE